MFDALETGWGLDVVLWLQAHRAPFLALLAEILDFAGEELLYIAIVGLIYWAFSKSFGLRLVFALILITLLTFFFKDLFASPRPYAVSDAVDELFTDVGYAFPSGHVAISLMFWAYFAYWLKKGWVWAFVIVYVLTQAFGRMIAGVHYPHDVIGGAILGTISLLLYIGLAERIVEFWKKQSSTLQLSLVLGTSLVLTALVIVLELSQDQAEGYLTAIGLLLGAGLGVWLEALHVNFKASADNWRRVAHYVLGLIIAIGLVYGLKAGFDIIAEEGAVAEILRVLRYGLVVFIAVALYPWASIRLGLVEKADTGELTEPKLAT